MMMNSSLMSDADICEGLDSKIDQYASIMAAMTYKKFAPFKFGPVPFSFKKTQRVFYFWAPG